MTMTIDEAFVALPLDNLADTALAEAARLGASYADLRVEDHRTQGIRMRDLAVESKMVSDSSGLSVRVIVDGRWGFAATSELTPDAAAQTARQAVALARAMAALGGAKVELAPEPAYLGTYMSDCDVSPFEVPDADKIAFMTAVSEQAQAGNVLTYVDFRYRGVREIKFLATSEGTRVIQQRVRVEGNVTGTIVTDDGPESVRTLCPPRGSGWEHITSGYDFMGEAALLPALVRDKAAAPSVEPGTYDLVIDPSNLWLPIHESIAHATERDRILGEEANYAGTSFVPADGVGSFVYGSPVMNIRADRTTPLGLSTVGWDDDGVAAQSWDLVSGGILAGFQLNRHMAHGLGVRSNGCAFADDAANVPIQRMPNVSLLPGTADVSLDDLVGRVSRGILLYGDNSWSIDMQRRNAQFSPQRAYLIEGGRVTGQLRHVLYQFITPQFWGSLEAVGGPRTHVLYGAMNCGKGQPGQVAPVSHGAPVALFRGVNVLNAQKEAA